MVTVHLQARDGAPVRAFVAPSSAASAINVPASSALAYNPTNDGKLPTKNGLVVARYGGQQLYFRPTDVKQIIVDEPAVIGAGSHGGIAAISLGVAASLVCLGLTRASTL